jgi:hypothetical protein
MGRDTVSGPFYPSASGFHISLKGVVMYGHLPIHQELPLKSANGKLSCAPITTGILALKLTGGNTSFARALLWPHANCTAFPWSDER